jgi:hypothetical protein
MIKKLFSFAAGWIGEQTGWLVLVAVGAVGAFLYVQFAQVSADRDAALHSAEVICAGAGADFAPSTTIEKTTDGKPVTVNHARGTICQRYVAQLAGFRAATVEQSAKTLADALVQHDAKNNADTAAARLAAETARDAALRMELADAQAERTNIVDHEWFAAVNGVAGLRAPGGSGRP